jgi:adenosylmethionine-8-amino-7-oxononanoate aminotransferase
MITTTPDAPVKLSEPDWFDPKSRHVWRPYTQMKTTPPSLPIESAQGVTLKLSDGRELICGVSSWWTACHGYSHPHIVGEIQRQVGTLSHVMLGGLTHAPAERLARRLADLSPGDLNHAFFCESGSVSVEIGMKMAIQYWLNKGEQGRQRFVSFTNGYHGDTFATMSLCDRQGGMHKHLVDSMPEQINADIPEGPEAQARFEAVLDAHEGTIAAVVTEPLVQGAGGMKFHSVEALQFMRKACDDRGLLLIADEIMTGFGRTGTMFACDRAEIVPDVMTVSKALTGGTLPLAAAMATTRVFDSFWSDDDGKCLMHGPTYMGNPAACAAANASLDLFEREPRMQQVAAIEAAFARHLPTLVGIPGLVEVRWTGALGVIEMESLKELDALKAAFVEAGVWVRPYSNVIVLMPPFVISEDELETLLRSVITVTRSWAQSVFD